MTSSMIKHKYIPPWKRKYEIDKSVLGGWQDAHEKKLYNARNSAFSFEIMAYWCLHDTKFDRSETFMSWWRNAFVRPFPDEGGTVEFLFCKIKSKLLADGYFNQGLEYDEETDNVGIPPTWDDWNKIKHIHIHFNKEYFMAKKSQGTSTPSNTVEPAEGVRMTKKRKATICLLRLMMEEQYTDVELREMVNDEVGYDFTPSRIERRRNKLNNGDMEEFGFGAPDEAIEQIGGDDPGSPRPKKPPLKPAKKKASAPPKKTGSKGLSFGKKKKKFIFSKKKSGK